MRRLLVPAVLLALAAPLAAAGASSPRFAHCVARATPGCPPARLIADPRGLAISSDGHVVVRSGVGSLGTLGVFSLDARRGRLRQLAGRAGCVARRTKVCANGRGLETPSAVAFSPVGRSVYVTAANGATLAHYRRARNGTLVAAGCWGFGTGCRPVAGLRGPNDVELWSDGSDLYVAADRLLAFSRNQAGSLIPKDVEPFTARAIALAPGGDSLYAVGPGRSGTGSLVVFRRDLDAGSLDLVQRLDSPAVPALRGPADVAVSPDGRHVYVASSSAAIAVFARDVSTGALTFASCVSAGGAAPCARVPGLVGVGSLAVGRLDGRVYAAAAHRRGGGLSVFRRPTETGALARLAYTRSARGMLAPNGVALSHDDRHLLVSSERGVAVFRR